MRLAGLLGTDPRHRPVPELSDRRLFVKTVYVPLAVEWLVAKFEVDVFVLLRHPGNVLASWISLDLTDRLARLDENPAVMHQLEELHIAAPQPDPLERLVWQIGVLTLALEQAAARHPNWVVRTHEELCIEPTMQFQQLYSELGLTWSERAEQYLAKNNRPGEGFPTQRVASDQPDAWKSRLAPDQIEVMQRVLSQIPSGHLETGGLHSLIGSTPRSVDSSPPDGGSVTPNVPVEPLDFVPLDGVAVGSGRSGPTTRSCSRRATTG